MKKTRFWLKKLGANTGPRYAVTTTEPDARSAEQYFEVVPLKDLSVRTELCDLADKFLLRNDGCTLTEAIEIMKTNTEEID